MIRLSFIVWLLLIASAGAGLYFLKYRVIELESALASVNRDIAANREATARLHAEWSYLNDPETISAYADHYLELRPATARDIVALSDIPLARGRAPAAPPSRSAPDGSTPPPPPIPPLRAPEPGSEPEAAGALLASEDQAPAPELSLVPAAQAAEAEGAVTAPADPIGRLIANVLEQRADAAPLGDAPQSTVTRGLDR